MRKIICLVIALILCLSLAAPAFAAESNFVPSITYKPIPDFVPVGDYIGLIRDMQGQIIDYVVRECLRLTPLAHIWDKESDIPEAIRELLTSVYEGLNDGSMKLPFEKFGSNLNSSNMVIRDLFDLSWNCDEHRAMIEEEGITFEVTFDLGIEEDAEIFAMSYDETENQWNPIAKTVNNGDGTVTCTFEHLCVIAFAMPLAESTPAPDNLHSPVLLPWIILLAVACLSLTAVLTLRNRKKAAV